MQIERAAWVISLVSRYIIIACSACTMGWMGFLAPLSLYHRAPCLRCLLPAACRYILSLLTFSRAHPLRVHLYTGWPPKTGTIFLYALTLSNINRFSKLFHCKNQKKVCNNIITKDAATHLALVKCHWVHGQTVAAFHWSRHWSVAWMRRSCEQIEHFV